MNQIKKKLNSDSGASMILVLVLMLICVMVSSVVIVAAASGANRNKTNIENQQEYLAVTSAARYIAENLNPSGEAYFCGVACTNEAPCSKYKNDNPPLELNVNGEVVSAYAIPTPAMVIPGFDNTTMAMEQFYIVVEDADGVYPFCESIPEMKISDTTNFSGPFQELMKLAASEVFTHSTSYAQTFTISVEDERLPDVECSFTMETNYSITIVIRSTNPEANYSMTVQMPVANVDINSVIDKKIVVCTNEHKYFYEYCDNAGNIQTSEIGTYRFQQEVTNATTSVTWDEPVINKGGE